MCVCSVTQTSYCTNSAALSPWSRQYLLCLPIHHKHLPCFSSPPFSWPLSKLLLHPPARQRPRNSNNRRRLGVRGAARNSECPPVLPNRWDEGAHQSLVAPGVAAMRSACDRFAVGRRAKVGKKRRRTGAYQQSGQGRAFFSPIATISFAPAVLPEPSSLCSYEATFR